MPPSDDLEVATAGISQAFHFALIPFRNIGGTERVGNIQDEIRCDTGQPNFLLRQLQQTFK
ncbi:MAG: hypothetical protein BWY09_02160 [Candidatus Hydrogenedentes bacterium ADurb.Bin179]|nr:MAG: hypothetical protein BWY09_02160 [Candidatus Hydrogenedentes bacterium ADurb.Bin179]